MFVEPIHSLQLSQKGKSSPSTGDVSSVPPTDVPLNTGESPAVSVPSSPSVSVPSTGDSTVQQPVTNQDVGTTTTDPIVVGPVASTTVTQLSADGIILGNYVYDTATVSGQAGVSTPTGTVTFEVKARGSIIRSLRTSARSPLTRPERRSQRTIIQRSWIILFPGDLQRRFELQGRTERC